MYTCRVQGGSWPTARPGGRVVGIFSGENTESGGGWSRPQRCTIGSCRRLSARVPNVWPQERVAGTTANLHTWPAPCYEDANARMQSGVSVSAPRAVIGAPVLPQPLRNAFRTCAASRGRRALGRATAPRMPWPQGMQHTLSTACGPVQAACVSRAAS